MAIGTQFWDKVVSYPDFANNDVYFSALPNDLAIDSGGFRVVNSSTIVIRSATATPYSTIKATFNGSDDYQTGSARYDGFVLGDFTYEAWVFPTNVTGQHMLFGGGTGQLSIYLTGTSLEVGRLNVATEATTSSGTVPINTWTKVAVTKSGTSLSLYINNVLSATGTTSIALVTTGVYLHARSFLNTIGFVGSLADILITAKAKTTFSSLLTTYPRYAAQITGTITETSNVTSWTITGISPTGLTATTTTLTSSYTLNCPSLEPYTITCSPTINGKWVASTAIALDYYVVATNPEVSPRLYKCTTAGTTSATEPTWPLTGTVTDGSVVWTFISDLFDPISHGSIIPS